MTAVRNRPAPSRRNRGREGEAMTNGQAETNGQEDTTRRATLTATEVEAVENLLNAASDACECAVVIESALQHHVDCRHDPEQVADLLDAVKAQFRRVRCDLDEASHEVIVALECAVERGTDATAGAAGDS